MMKKALCAIMAFCMLFTMVGVTGVVAAEESDVQIIVDVADELMTYQKGTFTADNVLKVDLYVDGIDPDAEYVQVVGVIKLRFDSAKAEPLTKVSGGQDTLVCEVDDYWNLSATKGYPGEIRMNFGMYGRGAEPEYDDNGSPLPIRLGTAYIKLNDEAAKPGSSLDITIGTDEMEVTNASDFAQYAWEFNAESFTFNVPDDEPEVYTITYVIDDVIVGTQDYEEGDAITELDAPVKDGYTFDGWANLPATMPAENLTITGSYTEIPVDETNVQIIVDVADELMTYQKGTFTADNVLKVDLYVDGIDPDTEYVQVVGVIKLRFDSAKAEPLTKVSGGQDTLVCEVDDYWNLSATKGYPGEIRLNFGMYGRGAEPEYDDNGSPLPIRLGTAYIKLNDETAKPGSSLDITIGTDEMEVTNASDFAQYTWEFNAESFTFNVPDNEPEVYTITYVIDNVTVGTQDYEEGDAITALDAPVKDGYTFDGWANLPATMPAENLTITGSYTKVPVVEPDNKCGPTAYWTLEDGILSITGTGVITNFTGSNVAPWEQYVDTIKAINIAEGITAIGNRAFMKLTEVTEISLPSTIETIGNYAFLNSMGIETINMSACASIGTNAFNGCTALTTVNVAGTKAEYDTMAANIAAGNLPFQRANITITDEATGNVAHASMSIYATWVYDEATKTLEIGNCPTEKAKDMLNFKNEASVPWVEYIDTIETVKIDGIGVVGSRTMIGAASLKTLEIASETVTRINSWAFYNAKALETVILPASIEALGTGAFYGNPLKSVTSAATKAQYDAITFGKSNDAFKRTTVILADAVQGFHSAESSAKTINWYLVGDTLTVTGTGNMASKDAVADQPWYPYKDQINNVVIEEGITRVGKYAFGDLANVTEITIPSTVTNVQSGAFIRMSGLETVNLSPGITSIGTNAFNGCSALKAVNFSGKQAEYKVMTIGSGNETFKNATLSTDENTYVGKGVIGSTITWSLTDTGVLRVMGTGAIPNYSSTARAPWYEMRSTITSVILSNGITKIGNQAFAAAGNLTTIDIPVTVTSVGSNAFLNTGLTTVNYAGSAEQYDGISVTTTGNSKLTNATVNYAE